MQSIDHDSRRVSMYGHKYVCTGGTCLSQSGIESETCCAVGHIQRPASDLSLCSLPHTQMSHLVWVAISQQLIVMSLKYSDCDRFGLVIVNIQATHEIK